jgi:hypothetical protein
LNRSGIEFENYLRSNSIIQYKKAPSLSNSIILASPVIERNDITNDGYNNMAVNSSFFPVDPLNPSSSSLLHRRPKSSQSILHTNVSHFQEKNIITKDENNNDFISISPLIPEERPTPPPRVRPSSASSIFNYSRISSSNSSNSGLLRPYSTTSSPDYNNNYLFRNKPLGSRIYFDVKTIIPPKKYKNFTSIPLSPYKFAKKYK